MDEVTMSRITVEQEADWLRVQDNFANGLQSSMEARLSSLPGGKDGAEATAVRKELEHRIKKVQEETFRLAKPNLRVNGYNYEDYVEATEPWDEMLDRSLKSIHAERVEAELGVTDARWYTPNALHRLSQQIEGRREKGEWYPADDVETGARGDEDKNIPRPPRHQEAVDTFTTVASNLSELAQTAPVQLARAQRAHGVREEISNMGAA